MLQAWRADGFGFDVLELWTVGYPTTEDNVDVFANGADAACFMDTLGLFGTYGAISEDLFLIDAAGMVRHRTNTHLSSLVLPENRADLDARVRALLP